MKMSPARSTRRPARGLAVAITSLLLSPAAWGGSEEQPEALIGVSESVDSHEGHSGRISNHEGRREEISDHEGHSDQMDSVGSEQLQDHHATSETLEGRSVQSERLFGTGHATPSASDELKSAEEALRAARAAHAQAHREHAPAAHAPHAASSSFGTGGHSQWMARLQLQQKRVRVAEANKQVWDARYASMIRNDYPRGDARAQILDQREHAKARLERERVTSQHLVEQARQAGVPEGVLGLSTH